MSTSHVALADSLLYEAVPVPCSSRRKSKSLMLLSLTVGFALSASVLCKNVHLPTALAPAVTMVSAHIRPTRIVQPMATPPQFSLAERSGYFMQASPVPTKLGKFTSTRLATRVHAYAPASVEEAWKNHFDAFGAQDVEKIALDYDDTSRVTVYNNVDESKKVFTGLEEIKGMFKGLFADLTDLSTLAAPVIDVDAVSGKGGQVFLVWKCPGCGYDTATDTFIFGDDMKIKFQNIVVTKK